MDDNVAERITVETILKTDDFKRKFDKAVDDAVKSFKNGFDDIEKKGHSTLDKIATKAGDVAKGVGGAVKNGMEIGIGGILAFGVASVKMAADFEAAMDQVGAVAGATDKQMEGLSKKALQIAADTKFGTVEVANAMETLAANGVLADDIINGAADAAVNLAAAGGTDLVTAADAVSTSMAVWSLEAGEAAEITNRLAGAANVSRFGVEDMALAIAQGGGAAATAGVEFGDFTTAIAAIAPSFSSGSDAGTSFKTFLVGLGGTSDKAKDAMKELGIITADGSNRFYDAQGNLKAMADVSQILRDATVNLTEEQRLAAFQTIFGTDAMRAAAAMTKVTGEEFQTMSDTMRDTDAAAVAAARMDNFAGAMEQLQGAIQTFMVTFGMILIPYLKSAAEGLAKFMTDNREEIDAFLRGFAVFVDSKVIPEIVKALKQFQQTLEGAMPVIKAVVGFLRENEEVAVILGIALLALAAFFGGPITAITALTIAGTLLLANWDMLRDKATEIIDTITGIPVIGKAVAIAFKSMAFQVRNVIEMLGDLITLGEEVVSFFKNVFKGDFKAAFKDLGDIVKAAFGVVKNAIEANFALILVAVKELGPKVIKLLVAGLKALPGAMQKAGGLAVDGLVAGAKAAAPHILDFVVSIPGLLLAGAGVIIEALKPIGGKIVDGIVAGAEAAFPVILGWLGRLPGLILAGAVGLATALVAAGGLLIDGLVAGAEAVWAARDWIAKKLPGEIIALVGSLATVLWEKGKELIGGLVNGAEAAWPVVRDFVAGLPGRIITALGDLLVTLYQAGDDLLVGLKDGAEAAWPVVRDFFVALPGNIVEAAVGLATALMEAGEAIIGGFFDAVGIAWELLDDFWFSLPSLIVDTVGSLLETLVGAAGDLIDGFFGAVVKAWDIGKQWFIDAPGNIVANLGSLLETLYEAGDDLIEGLFNGIEFAWDTGKQFLTDLPGNVLSAIGTVDALLDTLRGAGINLLTGLLNGAKEMFGGPFSPGSVLSFFMGIPATVVNAFPNPLDLLWDVGWWVIKGFKNGAEAAWKGTISWFAGLPQEALETWYDPAGFFTDSPSKKTIKIGKDVVDGLAVGASGALPGFLRVLDDVVKATLGGLAAIPTIIGDAVGGVSVGGVAVGGLVPTEAQLALFEAGGLAAVLRYEAGIRAGMSPVEAALKALAVETESVLVPNEVQRALFEHGGLSAVLKYEAGIRAGMSPVEAALKATGDITNAVLAPNEVQLALFEAGGLAAVLKYEAGIRAGMSPVEAALKALAAVGAGAMLPVADAADAVANAIVTAFNNLATLGTVLEHAEEKTLSTWDAQMLLKAGFDDLAGAVIAYQMGLLSLEEVTAMIGDQFLEIATSAEVLGTQFATSFADAVSRQEQLDLIGAAGVKMLDALNTVLTEGGPVNVQALADIAFNMIQALNENLPADEAAAAGTELMEALERAITEQSPEAIAALIEVLDRMDNAIETGTTEILSTVERFNRLIGEEFEDKALEDRVGAQGKRLIDALNEAIATNGERGIGTLAEIGANMIDELNKLDPGLGAILGEQLMSALQTALETGGEEAIQAVIDTLAAIENLLNNPPASSGGGGGGGSQQDIPQTSMGNMQEAVARLTGIRPTDDASWAAAAKVLNEMFAGRANPIALFNRALFSAWNGNVTNQNLPFSATQLVNILRGKGLTFREGGMIGPGVETLAMLHGGPSGEAIIPMDRLQSALAYALNGIDYGGGGGVDRRFTNYGRVTVINGPGRRTRDVLRDWNRMKVS